MPEQNKKILIVDDEKTFRDSIRFFLEDHDYEIHEAENGRVGTELISQITPDLVLIDLYMPEMTGLDVLQWISENAPDQPIIIISGAGVIHDVAEALRRGAWDYIFKPIEDLTVLKHAVEKALERAAFIQAKHDEKIRLKSEVELRTRDLIETNKKLVTQQQKVMRTGVEERVLGKLLQLTLRCTDETDFLNRSLDELTSQMAAFHHIDGGVLYLLSHDSRKADWRLESNAESPQTTLYRSPEFIRCLQKGIDPDSKSWLTPLECMDQRVSVIPVRQEKELYAVYALFPSVDIAALDTSYFHFLGRISDILSMGLGKFGNEKKIQYLAYHDVLTGLPNRSFLLERLEQLCKVVSRNPWHGVLLFIDMDRFKNLNDSLGHELGDELLRQIGERLKSATREEDLVVRLGGDEFVALMIEHKADQLQVLLNIQVVVDKIQKTLNTPYSLKQHDYYLTCSIGITVFSDDNETPTDLLKHADTALYRAKAEGGDIYRFYQPEMQRAADNRLRLEKDLRIALEQGQLEMYYQPQVSVDSGDIIGAEALIRWIHPENGMISPMDFIPVAEETGIILELGEWVLSDVAEQVKSWQLKGLLNGIQDISINLSPRQFSKVGFVERMINILKQADLDPSMIKLEITESTLIENVEEIIRMMYQLRNFGLRFSMDDFGTGYSSLNYLKRLPLDQLKIDQSFVMEIASDENDAAIVETIISIGKHLGIEVMAEGVETEEILNLLREKGCRSYQGYYFSRPLPAADFEAMLRAPTKDNA